MLVASLTMAARLSLEPLLDLLAVLARDLLQDYLPLLPRVLAALTRLVEQGAPPRMHNTQ